VNVARVIAFNLPPSLAGAFFRAVGVPRSTGFQVWVTGYEYGIGEAIPKRLPRAFRARQGMTAPTLTPVTLVNRARFQHGMVIWSGQPSYTPGVSEYGGIGANIWAEWAAVDGITATAYFMGQQMPFEVAAAVAPWDTSKYVSVFGHESGDVVGYVSSMPLVAGTYRVSMLPSEWEAKPDEEKYLVAATVYLQSDEETFVEVGPIGDVAPDATFAYGAVASMYDSPALAWTGYLDDSEHVTRDVTVSAGERIAVQYRNWIPFQEDEHDGTLNVKVEAV
jgi:hypothetical protein